MDDGRLSLASWRKARSWIQSWSGRLVSGFGLAMVSPEITSARKNGRRVDEQRAKDSKQGDSESNTKKQQDADQESDKQNRDKNTSSEADSQVEAQSAEIKSEKRARRDERQAEEETATDESAGGGSRRVSRRQEADSSSNENPNTSADEGTTRHSKDFAQYRNRTEEQEAEASVENPVTPGQIATSNPNVLLDDLLLDAGAFNVGSVVEGNGDVVANVSPGGGFAFARSGNVVAISGPDGATILHTDDPDYRVSTNTAPRATEPSPDGGNNDVDFTS